MLFRSGRSAKGPVSALSPRLARAVPERTAGKPLSKLAQCWSRYAQLVTNVKVREKIPFEKLDGVLDLVKQAEAMNVNMTLYEAGGYENLPKQLSQFVERRVRVARRHGIGIEHGELARR